VASTLHQCLKYYCDGVKKINGDVKPFVKIESHFADARFFEERAPFKEAMLACISSTGKRSDKDTYVKTNIGTNDNAKQRQQCERESNQVTTDPSFKMVVVATKPEAPVFRYIPKSRRKEGEAPFSKCTTLESATKTISKFKETNYRILGDKGVLPTHNTSKSRVAKAPLSGFIVSSKGSL